VILVQVLMVSQDKSTVKNEKNKNCFGSEWLEAYLVTGISGIRANGDGA